MRRVLLSLLVGAGALGLCADIWAIMASRVESRGGDSDAWIMFYPMIAVMFFLPVQLAAALALRGARERRKLAQQQDEPLPFTTRSAPKLDGLDDQMFARERARKMFRAAQWLVGVPAAAMAIAVLLHLVGLDSVVDTLAGLSLLWFPGWCAGVVAAGIALGRHDRWAPLAVAPLYPALSSVLASFFLFGGG